MRPSKPGAKIERKTLGAAWADYERTILDPIHASQTQRQEMRRAWYTGVAWLMDMLTFTLDEGEEATEDDFKYLDAVSEELEAFADKMKRGDA